MQDAERQKRRGQLQSLVERQMGVRERTASVEGEETDRK